jgi:hemerythrin-like domain-containing protein
MEATNILMDEHKVIERVLTALEYAADRVANGEELPTAFFTDAALFIRNFADGCHHRKEEGVLFTALTDSGMAAGNGPIAVMLAEHEQGRFFTRGMDDAARRWQAGDLSARGEVVSNARNYVALLRQHIRKENNILFPLADRVIPLDRQEKITIDFEHIEHEETGEGVHEKYLALAEQLEQQARKPS